MTGDEDRLVEEHPGGGPAGTPRRRRGGEVGAVLRLFREAFWLRALLLVVALCAAFVVLGRWQWERHELRAQRAERVTGNARAAPVPLQAVLADASSTLPAAAEWTRVQVRGRYEPDRTVLVRNRPLDGQPGYEVVVPLRVQGGAVLLVDRGWVPQGADGAGPAPVPPPPAGDVTVVARLRPSEPRVDRAPPPGQALRIHVPDLAGRLGVQAYQAYGLLDSEDPAPAVAPEPLPLPASGLGINLAYAVQWWGFALAALVLLARYARREVARRRDLDDPGAAPRTEPAGAGPARAESARAGPAGAGPARAESARAGPAGPEPARTRPPRALVGRSRRRELTDEEWEDAADRGPERR